MGFIRANTTLVLKEHKRRPFSGSLLCLGEPDVYFGYEALQKMACTLHVSLDTSVPVTPSRRPDFAARGCISSDTLFKSMGFESIDALDCSAWEGASIVHDLNNPDLPAELWNRFDAIIDHGTLEHVFHLPHALQNVFRMLKIGGRVIHSLPTSNLVDHGFYMFSPTLFYDFYTTNRWDINNIYVVSMTAQQETEPFFYSEYEPGSFDCVSYGGLNGMYFTVSIVTKMPDSTAHLIPQQGVYKRNTRWVEPQIQL